jgi:hypothetical protein
MYVSPSNECRVEEILVSLVVMDLLYQTQSTLDTLQ